MPETSSQRMIDTPAASDRPSFTLLINGEELSREFHVRSITVSSVVNKISFATIALIDGDPSTGTFAASSSDILKIGNEVELMLGFHSNEEGVFKGIITRQNCKIRTGKPPLLEIECKHKAVALSLRRKSKMFLDMSDADVIQEILGVYGLTKTVSLNNTSSLEQIVQFNASDWDFVLCRADVQGAIVITDRFGITIKNPQLSESEVLTLEFGSTITSFEGEIDGLSHFSATQAKAWDPSSQEVISSDGASPDLPLQGDFVSSDYEAITGADPALLQHGGVRKSEELQSWADARLLQSQLGRIRGTASCTGTAAVNVGDIIALSGVGNRIEGNAFVSGVRHDYTSGNWTTTLQFGLDSAPYTQNSTIAQPPASGLIPPSRGLQVGKVKKLEGDPAGEERIQVALPLIDDSSPGIWARIASPDASKERGIVFRPEIDDEVIVGFVNDDPRDAIILGMMFSSKMQSPIPAEDANNKKGIVTRSKMKVTFNDEEKSITIETPAGKKIIADENAGKIEIADENNNKIVMNSDGISIVSGAKITLKATSDFELQAVNVTIKADAQVKFEGSAGLEAKSAGTTIIKGSMVQIN
jgi:Rhs element Vgr protein